jgi:flagellar protein FlaJ
MNKLTTIFFELIDSVQITNNAFPLSPIDPAFMEQILPIMILMTSVISAIALKVAQGGLYKTVFYHIALLAILGSVTTFAMNILMTDFLETSILDFGDVGS